MTLGDWLRLRKVGAQWDRLRQAMKEGNVTGYRTILVSILGLLAAVGAHYGIVVSPDDQAAIAGALVSVVILVQRLGTVGPPKLTSATFAYMGVGLLAAYAQLAGVGLPEDERAGLVTGVLAVAGVVMRLITKTPVASAQQRALLIGSSRWLP